MAIQTYRLVTEGDDLAGAQLTYDDATTPPTVLRFQAQNNDPAASFFVSIALGDGSREQNVTLAPGQTINRAVPQAVGTRLVLAFRNRNIDGVVIRAQFPA